MKIKKGEKYQIVWVDQIRETEVVKIVKIGNQTNIVHRMDNYPEMSESADFFKYKVQQASQGGQELEEIEI